MNSWDKYTEIQEDEAGERLKAIAQNGATGEHYNKEDRKSIPVYSGVLKYFPDALKEVSKCSLAGNNQHHKEKPLHWDKSKSFDNEDALVRHLIDHTKNPMDEDGVLHLSKVAWRSLAALQIYLENN